MKPFTSILAASAICLLLTGCGETKTDAAIVPAAKQAVPATPQGEVNFPPDSPQLAQIKTEAVRAASVPVGNLMVPGKVEANANRLSHVVLPLVGRITSVDVKTGDFVRQGDPIVTVESPDADAAISAMLQSQQQVLQAKAQVMQAKAGVAKAQQDYDREKDLQEHGAIAMKEVLNAEAVLVQTRASEDQASASVQQANAAVEQNRRRLSILGLTPDNFGQRVTVKAPISGKVLELSVVKGEYRNDLSAPIVTIADLSSVWVTSDVPETAIRLVKVGEPVRISLDAYPNEVFSGRVTLISDTVDPQSRTIKVRAELPNLDARLKPEMFGSIQLAEQTETRPIVPSAAVVSSEGQSTVWKEAERGRFLRTAVTTGVQSNGRVAILSGLDASDRVVVDGVMLLQASR
jgi:cobalt-zinc-cadmium efflux system membrane fusion protein